MFDLSAPTWEAVTLAAAGPTVHLRPGDERMRQVEAKTVNRIGREDWEEEKKPQPWSTSMEQQTLQSTSAAFADVLRKKEISSSFPAQMVAHIKTGAACLAYLFVSLLLFLLFETIACCQSAVFLNAPRLSGAALRP